MMREYLKDLSFHYQGYQPAIKKAFSQRKKVPSYPCSYDYVCLGEEDYPKAFYDLYDPPFVLYYQGNLKLLQKTKVTVIGSRHPSDYAKEMTEKLCENLAFQNVLVSGLMQGIDALVHEKGLKKGTISLLVSGLDRVYPLENKRLHDIIAQEHLVMTEIPEGVSLRPQHFLTRNRLLAALASDLYLMSAWKNSACLKIVDSALELNRNIYCLPHGLMDASGEGCNRLILEGAMILTKEDLLFKI